MGGSAFFAILEAEKRRVDPIMGDAKKGERAVDDFGP